MVSVRSRCSEAQACLHWLCCGYCLQGMGEPLSNYDAVKAAVGLMADPRESATIAHCLYPSGTWVTCTATTPFCHHMQSSSDNVPVVLP